MSTESEVYAALGLQGLWQECSAGDQQRAAGGLLDAVRAVVAVRRGDVPQAIDLARGCLDHLGSKSWGVMIGLPLAALIDGFVLMGETDSAAEYLALAVPEAMFDTPMGLLYLRARGRYHLHSGRPQRAREDFERIAGLVGVGGLDLPALLPWPLDLAETYLRMGDPESAHRLAYEQMSRLPSGSEVRGTALRLLAATGAATRQVALLKKAVRELTGSGQDLQLACARWELSEALSRRGDERRADLVRGPVMEYVSARPGVRLPDLLFRPALAAGTLGRSRSAPGRVGSAEGRAEAAFARRSGSGDQDPVETLSDAEKRVAELAGQGKKNREIATQLQVTASTVEQHLTRVYRKLNVGNRSALRRRLSPEPPAGF